MRHCQQACDSSDTDAAQHDKEPSSYSRRSDRHRQRDILSYRRAHAKRRDSIGEISSRSSENHDIYRRTSRERQATRKRHSDSTARRLQRDGIPRQERHKSY